SQGEIAAAVVAGGLSLEDGARVVALRSRLLTGLSGGGGMMSVRLSADAVRERLTGRAEVSVAAVNGPGQTVVAGPPAELGALQAAFEAEGVRARMVPVDYASHSAQVEVLEAELVAELAGIRPVPGRVPLFSTVTGDWLDLSEMDAGYWYRNLRATVRFEDAVRGLADAGYRAFIEVSPHPVLVPGLQDTLDDTPTGGVVLETLRRDSGDTLRLATALSHAYVHGLPINWTNTLPTVPARQVPLPTYAFQHQHYWPLAQRSDAVDGAKNTVDADFWRIVAETDRHRLADELGVGQEPLDAVLPALSSWRQRLGEQSVLERWRYKVTWAPVAGGTGTGGAGPSGIWLVVTPTDSSAQNWTDASVRLLTECEATVVRLEVDPLGVSRTELADRVREILADTAVDSPAGVLSLLALAQEPSTAQVPAGAVGTLTLAQALGDADVQAPLWCLTRGAVSVTPEDVVDADQAQVWGIGIVAALEHPDRWGGLIDVPVTPEDAVDVSAGDTPQLYDKRVLDGLAAALGGVPVGGQAGAAHEDQLAIRPSGLHARRLTRSARPRAAATGAKWQARGTYLVTGGTGGLGGRLAADLARSGAEHLVLISRSGPHAPAAPALRAELEELGARVTIAACDVADRAALAALVADVEADGSGGSEIRGVVHAAGVGQFVELAATDVPEFARVVASKVSGARNLDELFGDRPLDVFLCYSSISSVWGGAGQGAYAAGNAFLDALMHRRRRRGLTGTSVAWGAWADAGLATGRTEEDLRTRGVLTMAPELAVDALRQALTDDETHLVVANIDWGRFAPVYTMLRPSPLLLQLADAQAALMQTEDESGEPGGERQRLQDTLMALPAPERIRKLTELVRSYAALVLGHPTAESVKSERPFRELGFDSLTAVDFRNRLATETGLALPTSLVFDYPTPDLLGRHLLGELLGDRPDAAFTEPVFAELERLELAWSEAAADSDAETRSSLTDRLQALVARMADVGHSGPALSGPNASGAGAETGPDIERLLDGASDDEIFDFISKELD
ncbi:SDR family NAD(P)-dependent oxidoreductase, partial [Streptomyces sp. NPDC088554]|uniref:SDR family NAD(P)-dependent oxidoreductase n=1 Tax=Streptomyces sp. NPDC088554 TaxID=3365865 RepID=UPI0037F581F2